MKIVFMGTPEFAVPCLQILVENGYNIVGVITMPDKEQGRGKQLQASPVKQYALSQNLPILQPEKLKNPAFLAELAALQADLQVVVAFRMLPAVVFQMPPKGSINLHSSLLPNYRGAAPINWAIINGETQSGLTTFFIEQEIDKGAIIFQHKMPIGETETAGELHDRMMNEGAQLLLQTVKAIETNNYAAVQQQKVEVEKHAPKIFKEDCAINWQLSGKQIYNFVRGLSPYPAAFTVLQNQHRFKIFATQIEPALDNLPPAGTLKTDNKTFIKIACSDAWVHLTDLQLAGKKRLNAQELLRGFNFEIA